MKDLQNFFHDRKIKVTKIKKYEEEKFITILCDKIYLPYLLDLKLQFGDNNIAIYPAGNELEILIDF